MSDSGPFSDSRTAHVAEWALGKRPRHRSTAGQELRTRREGHLEGDEMPLKMSKEKLSQLGTHVTDP